MKRSLLLVIVLICLLLSCSQKKTATVAIAGPFEQTSADTNYAAIRPALQTFRVNNSVTSTIKAAKGTEVLIPADCFVTADGDAVKDVQIELVEAMSLRDFVSSGLTTLSDGKLLMSNGMIYINARSGDENLQLKHGMSLSVNMPTITYNNGFQMFRGDGKNWTVDSTMTATDYAVTLPIDLLYPEGNKEYWSCIINSGNKDEKWYYLDTNEISLTKPAYERTLIATEAFRDRIWLLRAMMENMSFFTNRDYYFDKVDCEGEKHNYAIWKPYYDQRQTSIREADSLAKKIYVDYFRTNKDKIAAFCDSVNRHKRSYYSNWTDTNYVFDFRKQSLEDYFMEPLQHFQQSNEKIITIDDHGVDLDARDAFQQLIAKNVDKQEINRLLDYHFREQVLLKRYRQMKEALKHKEVVEQLYQSTVFSVTRMGWINCDRFFDDPSAGKAVMYVSNQSNNELENIDCSLVIPDLNVRLSAFQDSTNRWSFTKKEGPYTRLPIGKEAVITGVAFRHDSVFFARQNIKIKDGLSVALPMKLISKASLNDSLALALKTK